MDICDVRGYDIYFSRRGKYTYKLNLLFCLEYFKDYVLLFCMGIGY